MEKPETAREVLNIIKEFLNRDNEYEFNKEQRKLWKVLTGLRGPDNDDSQLKDCTTAVIRYYALGDVKKSTGAIVELDCTKYAEQRQELKIGHFESHVRMAFDALELNLDSVNK